MSYAALFAVAGDFGGRTCRRRRKQRVNGAWRFVFISDLQLRLDRAAKGAQ